MAQSRRGSFVEAVANTTIGWSISLVANLVVLPLFGYDVTFGHAVGIGVVFTAISFVRSYYVRRAFNSAPMRKVFDSI